jgi:FkbM family methyltransferase
MSTVQSQHMSKVAAFLAQSQGLAQNPFVVIDVGASGGLDLIWRQFEPALRAYCFDPLVAEVVRLNSLERNSAVRYFDAWITCGDEEVLEGTKTEGLLNNQSFHLTSATRAMTAMSLNFVQEHFNQGAELRYSEKRYSIDSFCHSYPVPEFDFLKVDTDGHDYFVLRGAEQSLTEKMVLGVLVECQFHGTVHPHANTFSNIDQFLRQQGFTLFDLDIWRYTRAALPGNFYFDIPASTTRGQVQWGDALYLVDPMTNERYFQQLIQTQYHSKLMKLIALYAMFGLEDGAAELICCLEKHSIEIAGINYKKLLDMLVPDNPWAISNYEEYIAFFNKDPTQFYPSNIKKLEEIKQKKLSTKIMNMPLLSKMAIGPAGARDGDRVRTRRAVAGHVVFGPYVDLMPGRYRLTVLMETDLALLGVNLAAPAMAIEVVCGRYIAARCHLAAEDLQGSAHTLLFTITDDFKDYFSTQKVECRIWTSGAVHAAIISITLDAADDEPAPDTSDFDWLPLLQVGPAGARADLSHVWVSTQPGKVGHVVFGPYVDLLPGNYQLYAEIAANYDSPLPTPKSQVSISVRPLHHKLSHKLSQIGHFLLSGFKKSLAGEAVAPLEIEVVTHDGFLTKVPIGLRRGVHTYEVSFAVSTEDFQRLPKGRLEFRVQSSGMVPWELRTLRLQRVE